MKMASLLRRHLYRVRTQSQLAKCNNITDEQLIALQYQMQISADLAFSSLAQKDDSHWGPSGGYEWHLR